MKKIQVCALIFLIFIMLTIMIFKNKKLMSKYGIATIILIVVFFSGYIYTKERTKRYENTYTDQEMVEMNIKIISYGKWTGYYSKYYCENEKKEKFLIYIKNVQPEEYSLGDNIHIKGIFNLPDKQRNYGGFNYRLYLHSINTYGMIYVEELKLELNETTSKSYIYKIQDLIRNSFKKFFHDDYAGMLTGMLIGETIDISDITIEKFQVAGILHLLAVSGANVAMVISMCYFIFTKVFGKSICNYISIVCIILFVIISNASPSVMRAGIMAIVSIVANLLVKNTSPLNNLFISAFIILLINPICIANTGFLLSYTATIGIIILSKPIENVISKKINLKVLTETISVTLAAQIILLPIMGYYFNSISILSLFTNLIIVPMSGILSILAILIFLFSLINFYAASFISIFAKIILDVIFFIVSIATKVEFLNLIIITPSFFLICLYYLIMFLYIKNAKLEKRKVLKRTIVILITLAIYVCIKNLPNNYIELHMIDVGQGDSFYIKTRNNKRILIDGGGSENSSYNVGNKILLPYILDRGFKTIDIVFISHPDGDHIDGILSIIKYVKIKMIVIGPNDDKNENLILLSELCEKYKIKIIKVSKNDKIFIDDILFKVIYPEYKSAVSGNNNSLVVQMTYANKNILFTGDIEAGAEQIVKKYIQDVDILKVAHHGSSSSSTEEFLKRVKPKISLISVSKKNKYGHPNIDVVERLNKYSEVYMTKDSGEVSLRIYDNGKIYVKECITSK